jgi:hypothetical protein
VKRSPEDTGPVARLDCPSWCTDHAEAIGCLPGMHQSPAHEHEGLIVRLRQGRSGTHVWLGYARIPAVEAADMASALSRLGHAELAATVKRLGELAEADAGPELRDDRIVNPVTHVIEHLTEVTS